MHMFICVCIYVLNSNVNMNLQDTPANISLRIGLEKETNEYVKELSARVVWLAYLWRRKKGIYDVPSLSKLYYFFTSLLFLINIRLCSAITG